MYEKEEKEKYSQLYLPQGKTQKNITEAFAGDIVAVSKLKKTKTGDTLCDPDNILKIASYRVLNIGPYYP